MVTDSIDGVYQRMLRNPENIRFSDLCRVCDHYFGEFRQKGGHRVYKMPWSGDPMINIQDDSGKAKAYQIRQVIKAIERLGE